MHSSSAPVSVAAAGRRERGGRRAATNGSTRDVASLIPRCAAQRRPQTELSASTVVFVYRVISLALSPALQAPQRHQDGNWSERSLMGACTVESPSLCCVGCPTVSAQRNDRSVICFLLGDLSLVPDCVVVGVLWRLCAAGAASSGGAPKAAPAFNSPSWQRIAQLYGCD